MGRIDSILKGILLSAWTADRPQLSSALYRNRALPRASRVAAFISVIQAVLTLGLPIGGFYIMRRRSGHTRRHLVLGAGLGGGCAGSLTAALAAAGGASFGDALPFAVLGLGTGVLVGLLGVAAFALGRWLSREP